MSEDKRNLPKGILAIGAHPDDVELGCGGTLAKYAKEGIDIYVLILTHGEKLSNNGERIEESMKALSVLGIRHVEFADFKDTKLYEGLAEVILSIEHSRRKINPQRVYTACQHDSHQDHWLTYVATVAACREIPQILCYETPSSLPTFSPDIFEDITSFLELKVQALKNHGSQKEKLYMQRDAITTRAKFRGFQAKVEMAEAFEACRFLL